MGDGMLNTPKGYGHGHRHGHGAGTSTGPGRDIGRDTTGGAMPAYDRGNLQSHGRDTGREACKPEQQRDHSWETGAAAGTLAKTPAGTPAGYKKMYPTTARFVVERNP